MSENKREFQWNFGERWSGSALVKRAFLTAEEKPRRGEDGGKKVSFPIYVRRIELHYKSRTGKMDETIRFPAHRRGGNWRFGDSRCKQSPMRDVRSMRDVLVAKIGESNADRMLFAVMSSL